MIMRNYDSISKLGVGQTKLGIYRAIPKDTSSQDRGMGPCFIAIKFWETYHHGPGRGFEVLSLKTPELLHRRRDPSGTNDAMKMYNSFLLVNIPQITKTRQLCDCLDISGCCIWGTGGEVGGGLVLGRRDSCLHSNVINSLYFDWFWLILPHTEMVKMEMVDHKNTLCWDPLIPDVWILVKTCGFPCEATTGIQRLIFRCHGDLHGFTHFQFVAVQKNL